MYCFMWHLLHMHMPIRIWMQRRKFCSFATFAFIAHTHRSPTGSRLWICCYYLLCIVVAHSRVAFLYIRMYMVEHWACVWVCVRCVWQWCNICATLSPQLLAFAFVPPRLHTTTPPHHHTVSYSAIFIEQTQSVFSLIIVSNMYFNKVVTQFVPVLFTYRMGGPRKTDRNRHNDSFDP